MNAKCISLYVCIICCFLPRGLTAMGTVPVIDAANLAQNIEQVAKSVVMINQQIRQIQLAFEQLQDMYKNSTPTKAVWDQDALPLLLRLGKTIEQSHGLAYAMDNLDAIFRIKFPGYVPTKDWHTEYDTWSRTTLDTIRGVMAANKLQAAEFFAEDKRMAALAALSESAQGRLAAIQVGNAIAMEHTRHTEKLRQLVMAQTNAESVYMANQVNEQAQKGANTRRFFEDSVKPVPFREHGF